MELNLLISIAGIMGSGISAYVGVRVALAEMRGDVKRLDKDVGMHDQRIARLEEPYFRDQGRP